VAAIREIVRRIARRRSWPCLRSLVADAGSSHWLKRTVSAPASRGKTIDGTTVGAGTKSGRGGQRDCAATRSRQELERANISSSNREGDRSGDRVGPCSYAAKPPNDPASLANRAIDGQRGGESYAKPTCEGLGEFPPPMIGGDPVHYFAC
jgi:hypothetical protein